MTQYFVRFTNVQGTAISGDLASSQWFAVSDPSYGSFQTLTIGSQTAGTGAGRVEFLGLSLTLPSSTLTEKIDLALEAGTPFKTIELVGYDDFGHGLVKTSSTVFKLADAAQDNIDISTGSHSLMFEYGGIVESTATYSAADRSASVVTAGWDRVMNVRDDSTTFDANPRFGDPVDAGHILSNVVPETYGAHRVFIQLRNFDGTTIAVLGSNWIEVDSAVASQLQVLAINSATSGIGAGRVTFNPLELTFKSGSLAPQLDLALAQGKPFQVELAVYGDAGGGKQVLQDDYQFGLAALRESTFAQGSQGYSLEYGSERMLHNVFDSNGVLLSTSVEGWDRVKNVRADTPGGSSSSFDTQKAPAALSDLTIASATLQAQQYYVRFTDQNGKVIFGDTVNGQWFEANDIAYSLDQVLAISSQTSGVGAGRVTFNDLSFTLGASKLTQAIDHALKAGIAFNTIEVVGYAQNSQGQVKVSSTVFKLAGAVADNVDPVAGTHALSFQYGGIVESIATTDSNGAVTGTVTAGWDRIKNVRDDSTTYDAKERADDPFAKGVATDKIEAASTGQHQVFLQIRNQDGTLLPGLGKQWISIDAGQFADLQTLAISSATTGIGAGKVNFEALKLVFNASSLSPVLDKAMAQGTAFQLELAVYAKTNSGTVLTDDYQFGLAGITQHTFGAGQHSYSFEYSSERTLHHVIDATGMISNTVIEGWDRVRNVDLPSPSGTSTSNDKAQAPATVAAISQFRGGPGATHYYVRITDYNDKALVGDDGKTVWFEVNDPSYSGDHVLTLLSGTGAGRVTFNPLSFSLGAGSLTEKLDLAIQKGTAFKTVELVGYADGAFAPVKVSSTVFKLAGAATDTIDAGSGTHQLTFEYGGLVESQRTFDPSGRPVGIVTGGWDRVKNAVDDSATFDATEKTSDPFFGGKPTGPIGAIDFATHHVYLQIRNVDGSAFAGLGSQWLAVDAALFGQMQTLNIGSTTGGTGAGRVSFDPLTLASIRTASRLRWTASSPKACPSSSSWPSMTATRPAENRC